VGDRFVWLCAAACTGCSLAVDLSGLGGGDASLDVAPSDAGDAAVTDASDAADASNSDAGCTGWAGPSSLPVPGTTQCIDSTEAPNADYAAFLAAFDGGAPTAECTWKTSWAPSQGWPSSQPTWPVEWVDWCDAYAFCAWAGKHLCGALDGGASSLGQVGNPNVDLWFRACSGDGQTTYPYGSNYQKTACRGADDQQDASSPTPVPVGSLATCQGGLTGLFDMSGNVAEWENACESTGNHQTERCMLRGGGMRASSGGLLCNSANDYIPRSDTNDWGGIRCCSDLQ
jgi:sulfatase modifying factor 1